MSSVPITRAVLIGKDLENDYEISRILQNVFNLQVSKLNLLDETSNGKTETSDELVAILNSEDVVYVLSNFEGPDFRTLHEKSRHHYRLISTHAIRTLCLEPNPTFPVLKVKRPIYCFFMTNLNFALDVKPYQTKRVVDLIHYMNGCVRKKFTHPLTLISDDCVGNLTRTAVSLNSRVLTTQFIEKCWERRDDINFMADMDTYMVEYALKCFGGLVIYFHGFVEDDMTEFREKTLENGGVVTTRIEEATHVVVGQDVNISRADFLDVHPDSKIVTAQWFWKSIHLEFCNHEELFDPFPSPDPSKSRLNCSRGRRSHTSPGSETVPKRGRKSKSSRGNLELSNASSYGLSEESLEFVIPVEIPKKHDRRYQVCMEMLATEQNYVDDLQLLITLFKEPLERLITQQSSSPTEPPASPAPFLNKMILSKQQINSIFGKIQPMLNIHQVILNSLDTFMKTWNASYDDIALGYVWAIHGPELSKVYPPYVNDYDNARETLDECLANIPKFLTFVKSAESDPKCRKRTVKDLLIKPVQRLPSVCLLLEEIKKRTDKNHKDYGLLSTAIAGIENVLQKTNNSRKEIECYDNIFSICNQIEGYPPALISANRTFHKTVELGILSGDGFFGNYGGRSMTIFLFNDFVAFTKTRSSGNNPNLTQSFYASTRGTLSRQVSFLQPKYKEKKKFKLVSMHRISDFRVVRFEFANEIIIVKVRNEESEYLFIGQPAGETTFNDLLEFFKLLCNLSVQFCGKELRMEELTEDVVKQLKNSANEDFAVIDRAICAAKHGSGSLRRRSTLRRAVSNVSLGISNGLQRFASRAHLSFINESSL
uniref:Protein ECT2 n=1 Tax=Panagrolaimus superbus TaxID=310955 RepID=A0A914XUE5_9BILA